MAQSIFHRIGGFAAVSKIVMDFYDRILDSETVGDYFEDIDVERLIDHQTKFISSLMGGPSSYTDEHLSRAHQSLNVDSESFDEMVDILCATLQDHNLDSTDIAQVRGAFERRRNLIVTS